MKTGFKLILVSSLLSFAACNMGGKEEPNPLADSLSGVNTELKGKVRTKDSTLTEFVKAFNEIQDNLDMVKEKEKILTVSSKDPEFQKNQKDQILDDIKAMYDLMEFNRKKINALSGRLKKAHVRIDELEKMVGHLTRQVEEKDAEIASLKEEVTNLNSALKELFTAYNERVAESGEKSEKLNTAYYVFGTVKELKAHGVLTREGGFIGMGRAEKLKDDFNKEYFTRIDITATTSIPLACRKAKFITTHPSGTYSFKGENKVEELNITNPEDFWSISKYLVVVVE